MDIFFVSTIVLSVFIIVYAYLRGRIDLSAVFASGLVGVIALLTVGVEWIYLILTFFVLGNLVTRYKYKVKEGYGVAEKVRNYQNVFGNGGAAMVFALLYKLSEGNPVFLLGYAGAMASAAADTFATEIGEVHGSCPRMVTNLKKAVIGTNGAISCAGCLAALMGAALVSAMPYLFAGSYNKDSFFVLGTFSGFFGCYVDSWVGATLEGRSKFLDNHMTNFIGTLAGGICGVVLYLLFFKF
jgi:uncharacterized protein (TIGR00297 family)